MTVEVEHVTLERHDVRVRAAKRPCPFCGAKDRVRVCSYTELEGNVKHTYYFAYCYWCEACGPRTGYFEPPTLAVEQWNKRRRAA